jgi:hypothetical protein
MKFGQNNNKIIISLLCPIQQSGFAEIFKLERIG